MSFALRAFRGSSSVVLGTLALSAWLVVHGVTDLIVRAYLPRFAVAAALPSAGNAERPPGADPPDVHAILARNVFDPSTGPLPKAQVPEGAKRADANNPPACQGPLRLVASVLTERTHESSLVSVAVGDNPAQPYLQGSFVQDMQLTQITVNGATMIAPDGERCALHMFEAPPVSKPDIAPRVLRASMFDGAADLLGRLGVVPHEENGRVIGVKLYGIRRNSLLSQLGLQNGDLLRTINGLDLSTPARALDAYAQLRNADHLSVALVRRGRPVAMEYRIE